MKQRDIHRAEPRRDSIKSHHIEPHATILTRHATSCPSLPLARSAVRSFMRAAGSG